MAALLTSARYTPLAKSHNNAIRDLLSRHIKLKQHSRNGLPFNESVSQEVTTSYAEIGAPESPDFVVDPDLFRQDMLPSILFDFDNFNPPAFARPHVQSPSDHILPRFSTRLPILDDANYEVKPCDEPSGMFKDAVGVIPWAFSDSVYEGFCLEVESFSAVLPTDWELPSRNSLSRNLESYFRCVQESLPFIHSATFSVAKTDVELLLAAAALGALNRFENHCSYILYFMSKAILAEKMRFQDFDSLDQSVAGRRNGIGKIQTLNLLVSYASWAGKDVLQDGLALATQLSTLVRRHGLSEDEYTSSFGIQIPDNESRDQLWCKWVAAEERRRTLLCAYVLLSLQNIAYNTPPQLLNEEIATLLPSCVDSWKKTTAEALHHPALHHRQYYFKEALSLLSRGIVVPVSSFANYVLILGLLQQIILAHSEARGSSIPHGTLEKFEHALRTWQLSWECTYEATLDPLSEKGPLGLNATALLRLAYIRLNSNMGSWKALSSRDPGDLGIEKMSLERTPQVDRAVLHAAHALSIPVRLGIGLVTHTRLSFRSIEHSLSSLECVWLLKGWLDMISSVVDQCGLEGLRNTERRLLDIITGVIGETSFAETLNTPQDESSRYHRMAIITVQLWAQIFQGVHVLEIDKFIGSGLQLLADTI
ncbi:hypothetical protein PV08_03867 [Exophiala spinifera]|uniref:Xylanolytic transcriptional activator regulatory domain-containing protein n=1 Tax=Exophiala spinifera TaxID=91928 RepID=A0A0D2BZD3_9EURO|nr:uncharacterized protein PV08_03867 [Exophiala spinifera]KIW16679.1 hypothetical protein PV08_03867 [Exophiala spinifera]